MSTFHNTWLDTFWTYFIIYLTQGSSLDGPSILVVNINPSTGVLHTFIRVLVHSTFTQLFFFRQASLNSGVGEIIIVFITFKNFKTQCSFNLEDMNGRDLLQSILITMLAFKGNYEKFFCKRLEISSYLE